MVIMERWPNFFIVGAPKAGTTSLFHYLDNHPEIFLSHIKEPNFFSVKTIAENHHIKPIRDKKNYLELFKNVKNKKIIGEASTSYLADPEAPKLIHEVSPDAFILISLRDPVERIFSHFLMYVRDFNWTHSFHEQLTKEFEHIENKITPTIGLEIGLYYKQVKRYYDIFGKKNLKIIFYEEFSKQPSEVLKTILQFLDVEPTIDNLKTEIYNPYFVERSAVTRGIRTNRFLEKIVKRTLSPSTRLYIRNRFFVKKESKPTMNVQDRQMLIRFYRDDVEKLGSLLNCKLPWTNF